MGKRSLDMTDLDMMSNDSSKAPKKTERSHEENQERAYIAASRRSDRSIEARIASARAASEVHWKRTGKRFKITPEIVMNEEMYEEEDDPVPRNMRPASNMVTANPLMSQRVGAYVACAAQVHAAVDPEQVHAAFDRAFPAYSRHPPQVVRPPMHSPHGPYQFPPLSGAPTGYAHPGYAAPYAGTSPSVGPAVSMVTPHHMGNMGTPHPMSTPPLMGTPTPPPRAYQTPSRRSTIPAMPPHEQTDTIHVATRQTSVDENVPSLTPGSTRADTPFSNPPDFATENSSSLGPLFSGVSPITSRARSLPHIHSDSAFTSEPPANIAYLMENFGVMLNGFGGDNGELPGFYPGIPEYGLSDQIDPALGGEVNLPISSSDMPNKVDTHQFDSLSTQTLHQPQSQVEQHPPGQGVSQLHLSPRSADRSQPQFGPQVLGHSQTHYGSQSPADFLVQINQISTPEVNNDNSWRQWLNDPDDTIVPSGSENQ